MSQPVCTIIAGPNGAGKSTFVIMNPKRIKGGENFINADLIASGLSPFAPERESISAGKLFLEEIRLHAARRKPFSFETTLSGRTQAKFISHLIDENWLVEMIYLWIPNAAMSLDRVQERVEHGGHNIPSESIIRRYPKSIYNLLHVYSGLCTSTICLDNTNGNAGLIFTRNKSGLTVINEKIYKQLVQIGEKTP